MVVVVVVAAAAVVVAAVAAAAAVVVVVAAAIVAACAGVKNTRCLSLSHWLPDQNVKCWTDHIIQSGTEMF